MAPGTAMAGLIEAIDGLPTSRLRTEPLQYLFEDFRLALKFDASQDILRIVTEADMDSYAFHVAGTVAESILDLLSHHFPHHALVVNPSFRQEVFTPGIQMGKALQYINIARDTHRDAAIGRVYLPTALLKEVGISPKDLIFCQLDPRIDRIRSHVLARVRELHDSSEGKIQCLLLEMQGPLHATVKRYMEIGATLKRGARLSQSNQKLRLSTPRRLIVAYKRLPFELILGTLIYVSYHGYLSVDNAKPDGDKTKTYNSEDSLVVTHPTTNSPACGLSTAERTGSPVFHTLWSYVSVYSGERMISCKDKRRVTRGDKGEYAIGTEKAEKLRGG
ncbi:hypothetical protein N7472_000307 [Penicillium cf. griseofulvum]|uniref:15-cis-phytoene synthase n=1 Tax=Penicillium cf. griseofulvum TaxID=2972120 RepID=A0A9W9T5D8_9EURO|nr:hypothetical protein N7472_000307 [Penicillium cf. griseofulvum]KAJ5424765.1 hypothetical protein N7445_010738 [Penicillium cf. griseofulvum]